MCSELGQVIAKGAATPVASAGMSVFDHSHQGIAVDVDGEALILDYFLSRPYLRALCGDTSGQVLMCILDAFSGRFNLGWGPIQVEKSAEDPGIVAHFTPDPNSAAPDVHRLAQRARLVVGHIASTSPEVFWDAATYQERAGSEFYTAIAAFQRQGNVRLQLNWPTGATAALTVEVTGNAEPDPQISKITKVAQLQLFITHLVEATRVAFSPRALPNRLTERQAELLALTLMGHSIWDISQRCRLSDSRVCGLLKSAGQSLETPWRHQAAARALHLGWLDGHL